MKPSRRTDRNTRASTGRASGPGTATCESTPLPSTLPNSFTTELGKYSFIGPNATLCGGVCVGECSFIGAGATVLNKTKIVYIILYFYMK